MSNRPFLHHSMLFALVILLAIPMVACNKGTGSDAKPEDSYTWWITKNDGQGVFYTKYEENSFIQWINNQLWSMESGTYTSDGTGTRLNFGFQTPVSGSESDNFNTMIATGSYPEIIDLSYSDSSPKQLYDDGILIEITDYVNEYMPDYLAYLEEHPNLKPFVSYLDDEGVTHFYSVYAVANGPQTPWMGFDYRRDWVVKYADPTPYVWDWESAYVQENGHPQYTPLSAAQTAGNYTGWKANSVTEFTSNFGDEETWTDNVIFPSGTADPLYISDWEWMFEAFAEALEDRGFSNNSNAYVTTLYYPGFFGIGDLVSSFGGGGPVWYIEEGHNAAFGGTSENFRTYVSAMNTWYNNGWIDPAFETRGSDSFWQINRTGFAQGMVGLSCAGVAFLGTTIRATCTNAEDKEDAILFGSALPINDVYGGAEQKFINPDTFYSQGLLGTATGFTTKIEDKNLPLLFTYLNWMYSDEGSIAISFGLDQEKYESMTLDPDMFAEYDLKTTYTIEEDELGNTIYVRSFPADHEISNAFRPLRMAAGVLLQPTDDFPIDNGYTAVVERAFEQSRKFSNTGYAFDYNTLMDSEQSSLYARTNTYINDCMSVEIPKLIKQGMSGWDSYVTKVNKYGPQRVTAIYQAILDRVYPEE